MNIISWSIMLFCFYLFLALLITLHFYLAFASYFSVGVLFLIGHWDVCTRFIPRLIFIPCWVVIPFNGKFKNYIFS